MYGNSGQNNMEYNSGSNYMNYTNGSGQQNSGNQVYNTSLHNNSQTYLNRSEPVQQQSPYSSSATPLSSSQLYLNQQHPQQQPQQQQQQQPQQQQQHNLAGSGMENYTGNVYHTYGEQQQQQAAQSSHAGPQFDESNVAQQHQKFYAQQVQQSAEPHLNGSHANKTDVVKGTNTGSNYMYFERRPDLLSKSTQEKAAAVKLKIENFYQTAVNFAIERNQRRIEFENNLQNHYQDWSDERKYRELTNLGKKESHFLRLRRTRLSLDDFKTVKVIGKGAFGEVRLVQKKDTGKIYAMKTLLKSEMYKKDQLAHVKAERDVLAGADSPWVVSLYYSFQDTQYLYLIMEFLPGGDLMTMLIRWQIFTEDVTRFYMAECILAIEAIHKLGFIHRDIKPDNILIDIRGHIKLSDFGLSTGFHKTHDTTYYKKLLQEDENSGKLEKPPNPHSGGDGGDGKHRNSMMVDAIHLTMTNRQQMQTWRKSRRLMAYSTVGTPDYIAPEIFLYQGYGQECDWWSLGAIMYECLIGWPPFCSETPQETYRKIMNFEKTLQFPDDIHISYEAEDFIKKLLTHADQRLGRHGGAEDLKKHPFFRGVDWNTIRQVEAPYIPKLSSITDTRFFPTDELENVPDSPAMALAKEQQQQQMMTNGSKSKQPQQDLPFIGYTYSRFDYLTTKNVL